MYMYTEITKIKGGFAGVLLKIMSNYICSTKSNVCYLPMNHKKYSRESEEHYYMPTTKLIKTWAT